MKFSFGVITRKMRAEYNLKKLIFVRNTLHEMTNVKEWKKIAKKERKNVEQTNTNTHTRRKKSRKPLAKCRPNYRKVTSPTQFMFYSSVFFFLFLSSVIVVYFLTLCKMNEIFLLLFFFFSFTNYRYTKILLCVFLCMCCHFICCSWPYKNDIEWDRCSSNFTDRIRMHLI